MNSIVAYRLRKYDRLQLDARRRRPTRGYQPLFDKGQEGVLLRFVEAMYLIDEKQGVTAELLQGKLGALNGFADVRFRRRAADLTRKTIT